MHIAILIHKIGSVRTGYMQKSHLNNTTEMSMISIHWLSKFDLTLAINQENSHVMMVNW